MALLDQIEGPNDIKKLQQNEWDALAEEIRRFLVRNVSMTGGHLASNLGVVELTMALHLALDLPNDKIVWDVGHQSYTHKILTGRKDGFMKLRQYGGISGFPKRSKGADCKSAGLSFRGSNPRSLTRNGAGKYYTACAVILWNHSEKSARYCVRCGLQFCCRRDYRTMAAQISLCAAFASGIGQIG